MKDNPHRLVDCKRAVISPAGLILQTDRRWPLYLGVPRWGCYWKDCLGIPQLVTGIIFDIEDERMLYDRMMANGLLTIERVDNNVIKPYIPDTEALITYALGYVRWKGRAVHIGDEKKFLSYAMPHRTDFTLVRRLSVDRYDENNPTSYVVKGHHFVLGNENGVPVWDSCPGLDLEDDPKMVRIRIDGGPAK